MASSSKAGEMGYAESENKQEEGSSTADGGALPRQPAPAAQPRETPPRTSSLRRYSALTVARVATLASADSSSTSDPPPVASRITRFFTLRRRQGAPSPPPSTEASPTSTLSSADAHLLPTTTLARPPRLPLFQLLRQHPRTVARPLAHMLLGIGLLVAWAVLATHFTGPTRKSTDTATSVDGNSTSTFMASAKGEISIAASQLQPNDTGDAQSSDGHTNATGNALNANVMLIGALFLLGSIINAGFLYVAVRRFLNLWRPPLPHTRSSGLMSLDARIQEMRSRSLPTYVAAVGGEGGGTGDVEDRWIVGEGLPRYGETRHSTLLLRSESRQARNEESSSGDARSSHSRDVPSRSTTPTPPLTTQPVAASRAVSPQLSESIRTSFHLLSQLERGTDHDAV